MENRLRRRQLFTVADDQPRKLPRLPVPRQEAPGVGNRTPEPSKAYVINPCRDMNLISSQKADRSSDTVNPWQVAEAPLEIKAQGLLYAAAHT